MKEKVSNFKVNLNKKIDKDYNFKMGKITKLLLGEVIGERKFIS